MFENSLHRYNSAVYAVQSGNQYTAFVANQAFIDDTECRNCSETSLIYNLWANSTTFDKLGPADCIAEYGAAIQPTRSHVLLVTNDTDFRNVRHDWEFPDLNRHGVKDVANIYLYHEPRISFRWICSGEPTYEKKSCQGLLEKIKSAQQWRVGGKLCPTPSKKASIHDEKELAALKCETFQWPIQYCLSKKRHTDCKLEFNRNIAVVIICFNFCKYPFSLLGYFTKIRTPYYASKQQKAMEIFELFGYSTI
jgi:hypothetical protein